MNSIDYNEFYIYITKFEKLYNFKNAIFEQQPNYRI